MEPGFQGCSLRTASGETAVFGEARLPAIRAAAPEEANRGQRALITPLHANVTVFFFWTSSSGGQRERK